ncbi:MAG: CDP-alcohol phosphatidyltransferase family protein [Rhodospirillum sp.]|nr:CDP-alcohol phosphatidyltransferase family protein [Rhodospirillum sp.]MCF8491905.1 CDP-alcohol phosphatidyltransferase family protein [Rhodospirillum sp.]MCF8503058.1 CDP-alcohol phosphatidyltransferase family protein [Rhodospirillum sp.]
MAVFGTGPFRGGRPPSIRVRVRAGLRGLPNALTLTRFALVPLAAVQLFDRDWRAAFWVFVAAGVTDALDGWLARLLDARSTLGATLDPLADKALLVTTFTCLALVGEIPYWLLALVVVRDLGILLGAAHLRHRVGRPLKIRPSLLGKANTLAQILLCAVIIGVGAFPVDLTGVDRIMILVVAAITLASGLSYLHSWYRRTWDGQSPPRERGRGPRA